MKQDLEKRIEAIEVRNTKVELDKAWETSWVRRISIAVLTYVVVFVYLTAIKNEDPFINAFVPAIGYLLSTLVMKQVKNIWQKR